ncbi:hypothetical protein KI387_008389 [Taxus chinensis]|uniref:Nuclear pore complex protein n=1 Tax=Taxus chinensis TaxID=29808 RepID=A0AA38FIL8_TAXCH|nr:hypothetical protein KI387_008389 [Taxus chinensis]
MEVMPYYQSGAGGKQLRPRRRHVTARTPYDRPLEGRHSNFSSRSWLSKLVSPITSGAGKLFSSVFQRPEETSSSASSDDSEDESSSEEEGEDNVQEPAVPKDDIVIESDIQGREPTSAAKQRSESKLSEIENLLNSKTFTRDEFIHLTVLLQSRVVDSSGSKEHGQNTSIEHFGNYLRDEALEEAQRWREERRKSQEESGSGRWDSVLCGSVSSLALSADVPDNAASSPVDIAKAYMGVRPTWASSSPPALLPYKSSESSYLKNLSFAPTTKECWSISNSQHEDKYGTPTPSRTWNSTQRVTYNPYSRAAVTQTPYYRGAYSQHSIQRADNAVENDTTSSRWTQMQHSGKGGREILKRRCSVIDDEWACVGPIRKIRQKSFGNVSSFSSPFKRFESSITDAGSSLPLLSSGLEAGPSSTFKKPADVDKSNPVSTSFQIKENVPKICGVPTQSSLMAQKILENSNGKVPLPNKNPAEEQLANAQDITTHQLTTSVINANFEKSNNIRNASSTPASLEIPGSILGGPAISEKIKYSQPNIVEGLENKACESREDAITLDIQTSKSVSLASDVGINSNQHPTFEFGSANTCKGPIFSFGTNGTTYSDAPKFDFKFESKREMLFSAAVEAAVASESSSQLALSSSPMPTSQSALAASGLGLESNSKPAFSSWTSASLQSISSFPFSGRLFTGSLSTSFQSTSSSLFIDSVTTSPPSLGPFGFSKLGASASAPVSFTSLTKFSSKAGTGFFSASGSRNNTSFGSANAIFGAGTSPISAASFGSGATASSSSGLQNTSTLAFGSSTLSTSSSGYFFSPNSIAEFKSNSSPALYSSIFKTSFASSPGLGTSSQFGSGGSVNGESKQTFGLLETEEAVVDKSASQTNSSIGLDGNTLTSVGFASSSVSQKPIFDLTSSTLAVNTSSMATTLVDGLQNGQMNGKDLKEPSKLSSTPLSVSAEQTSSSTVSRTSAALTIDSQSNVESSEAHPSIPSQKSSVFGAQSSIVSGGPKEVADNGGEKRSRKIVRIKRDRTRKK